MIKPITKPSPITDRPHTPYSGPKKRPSASDGFKGVLSRAIEKLDRKG